MSAKETPEKKSIFAFLIKAVCAYIAVPTAMYIIFPAALHQCFNDRIFSAILMMLNGWTVLGILICTFMLALENQKDYKKLWLVFFVPTIGWYLISPIFCAIKASMSQDLRAQPNTTGDYLETHLPPVFSAASSDSTIENTVKISPNPIFYARYSLSPGTKFTIASVKVLSAEEKEVEGSILANAETYFGKEGSPNSILTHKAKNAIAAGAPIKNSDLDPPFESRFVLKQTAKK